MAAATERVFKTAWFAKAARKAGIQDRELCGAVREVIRGQADALGGGVFKKRLGRNLYRSIVLARGRQFWIFAYLFAKKDRANIDLDELNSFRALAALYAQKTPGDLARELRHETLVEICDENQTEVQE